MDALDTKFASYWNALSIDVRRLATQHWAQRACARLSLSGYQMERQLHPRHRMPRDSAVEIDGNGQWYKYLRGKASVSSPEKLRGRFCWIHAIDQQLPGHSSLLMAPLWRELTPRLTDESQLLQYTQSLPAPFAEEIRAAALRSHCWSVVDEIIDWERCFTQLPIETSLDIAGRWRCWLASNAPHADNAATRSFDRRICALKFSDVVDRALHATVCDFWKENKIPAVHAEAATTRKRIPLRAERGLATTRNHPPKIPVRNYFVSGNSSRRVASVDSAWRALTDQDSLRNWDCMPLHLRRLATRVWVDEALQRLSSTGVAARSNAANRVAMQPRAHEAELSELLTALRLMTNGDCAVPRPRTAYEDTGLVMEVERFTPGLRNILEWDLWCLLSVTHERETTIGEMFGALPLPVAKKLAIVWRKFENEKIGAAPLALVLAEVAHCDAFVSWPTVAQLCQVAQLRMSFEGWLARMDEFWAGQAARTDLGIASLGTVAWRVRNVLVRNATQIERLSRDQRSACRHLLSME